MPILYCLLITIALILGWASPALAQDVSEKVWAVFTYSVQGESTPSSFYRGKSLTAYGADGLYAAGSAFRDRYVAMHSERSTNRRVENLSPYILRSNQVSILSATDQPSIASAQAFMQGLYPPVDTSYGAPYIEVSSQLANGSNSEYPLSGYQYPPIVTLDLQDPRSLVVSGQTECLLYQALVSAYNMSQEAERITHESKSFYNYLFDNSLVNAFDRSAANYENACEISEYLEYQSVHNESLFEELSQGDINRARWYADQYTFATNGNTSSTEPLQITGILPDGRLRTIAGQTLASHILTVFESNIKQQGTQEKISFAFGSYEPAVALASLMGLASLKTANFYSRPVHGASLVFEMFSLERKKYPTYPSPSDLFVRFSLRNGTNASTPFISYPLFGHSPSNAVVPLSEFRMEMRKIASKSTENWCLRCGSPAVFCTGVVNASQDDLFGADNIDPTIAGVIGAVVTFVFLAIMAIIAFLICGVRLQYKPKPDAGGFKRDGKMASDSDLIFKSPQWGDKSIELSNTANDSFRRMTPRGHERSESWGMVQQRELNHSDTVPASPLLDEDQEEWRVHSVLEPARVRESV
ncbi:hypothetical protein PHISCL_09275 [Aspergillus sclerotialis]|uniref:Histidine acid phosphatase n=1 Tax=Aspergillus sclerotialis TaxID=2070753 RepID=A0A3A2ZAS3_9EURO|nr:hypothetical protein PHISCL_09275 [Aspergillus sclerotialis]